MKPKNLYKLANFSGWALLVILILYFISGYAMVHKYGMDYIMSNSHAWVWHKYLTIPFFVFLFLHIVPYYVVREQVKKLCIILALVFAIPALGVFAIDKVITPQKESNIKEQASQKKSVKCKNCPNECILKPGETGKCGQYQNIDGEIKPTREAK